MSMVFAAGPVILVETVMVTLSKVLMVCAVFVLHTLTSLLSLILSNHHEQFNGDFFFVQTRNLSFRVDRTH